ncbi:MAG: endolytic transglycosylase MltG [Oscillospiraceae bacterium]|jgi:UPF0755 protein|nr:endolytic transglycosylase MltG [Oscillospiraceae bacterium]
MAEKRIPEDERRSPNVRPKFVVSFDENSSDAPHPDGVGQTGRPFGTARPGPSGGTAPVPPGAGASGGRGVYFASAPPAKPAPAAKPAAPQGRPAGTKKKKRRASGGMAATRSVLISLVLVVFSGLLALWGGICMNDVLAFDRDESLVMVNIPEKADTGDIIDILKDNGLIRQKWFCKLFNKIFHTSKDKDGNIIQPKYLNGVYYVKSNEGFEGLLNTFKSLPVTAKTITVVFPEGYTTFQIFQRLEDMGVCRQEHLYSALQEVSFDFKFIDKLPKGDSNRPFLLEGYLFPAQYEFYEGEDANSVIRRMLTAFEQHWTAAYQKRAESLGLTMDEVMTLASVIEKEAGDAGQMPGISYVIHNRLNHSANFPEIGCDATKEYITTFAKARMLPAQVDAFAPLYDTVGSDAIKGLPPGPICSPGTKAVEAALNPESPDGKAYYYFLHDKNGKIYYCSKQSEFNVLLQQVSAINLG